MAIVIEKLLTVLGFKVDKGDLDDYRKAGRKARGEVGRGLEQSSKRGARGLSGVGVAAGVAGGAVGGLIAVAGQLATTLGGAVFGALQGLWGWLGRVGDRLAQFTAQVFDVNASFESQRELLKKQLGSETAADKMLAKFETFAATTPFQLKEINDLFLNISGLGGNLGQDGLKAIGDLAARAGISLHDFSEVFKSAAQGNAAMVDRLAKAGGIRAITEKGKLRLFGPGDKEGKLIDPSDTQELLNFFIAAGKAKGIEGSMADLSKTLGGLLSTIKDNAAGFLRAVGQGGFNKAVKGFFSGLIADAPRLMKVGTAIGGLMGRIIDFGSRVRQKLNLDSIAGVVEGLIDRVSDGLDALTGGDAAGKLAAAIEAPFKLIQSMMMIFEGRGSESPLGRWMASFEKDAGPLGDMALRFKAILQEINEILAGDTNTGGLGQSAEQLFGEHMARSVDGILHGILLVLEHRDAILQMLANGLRLFNLMSAAAFAFGNALMTAMGLASTAMAPVISDINALIQLLNGAFNLLRRVQAGAKQAAGDYAGKLGNLLGSLPIPNLGQAQAAAANRVAGVPGAGGGTTTNTTTTTNTNSTTFQVGSITVKSPSEIGNVLGGLASAARGAGGA